MDVRISRRTLRRVTRGLIVMSAVLAVTVGLYATGLRLTPRTERGRPILYSPAVLWRRRSFGTQSEEGSRFVERVLTAVTPLRQQNRDVLDYLTEACAAAMRGDKAPSLLPDASIIKSGA
jgi:hypothetical protein